MKKSLVPMFSMLLLTVAVFAAEKADLEGITCVVAKKNPAKAENSVAYKGGEVYFCCKNCPKEFAKNTEKHATRANYQLVATKQAKQEKCPLTGRPLNESTTIAVSEAEVTFCCNNCKGKVASAEGDDQITLVFSEEAWKKAGFEVKKDKQDKQE